MRRIEYYNFGKLVINGKKYVRDLIVGNEEVLVENWWREEGHRLRLNDIKAVLEDYKPEIIVVGSGYYGYMRVDRELEKYLESNNIELIVKPTREAVEIYNKLVNKGIRVLGAFHLTC